MNHCDVVIPSLAVVAMLVGNQTHKLLNVSCSKLLTKDITYLITNVQNFIQNCELFCLLESGKVLMPTSQCTCIGVCLQTMYLVLINLFIEFFQTSIGKKFN